MEINKKIEMWLGKNEIMGKAFSSLCHKIPCRKRDHFSVHINKKISIIVNNKERNIVKSRCCY